MVALGEHGEASSVDGVLDSTASMSLCPGRADIGHEETARPSTSITMRPSDLGSSRPSISVQVSAGAESQGPSDTESLRGGTALGDPATAIALFQSILLLEDVGEMS